MPSLSARLPLGRRTLLVAVGVMFAAAITLVACQGAGTPSAPSVAAAPAAPTAGASQGGELTASADSKVQVCHRPPGNPTNRQVIRVAQNALRAHLSHGDNVYGPEVCDSVDNDCDGQVDQGNVCSNCAGAGGTEVLGACWFLGANGQSCTAVCGGVGLSYDDATRAIAGSGGSGAACSAVLGAIGAPDDPARSPALNNSGVPFGCAYCCAQAEGCGNWCSANDWVRNGSPATTAEAGTDGFLRACACS
jgi:hypothetical protein